MSAPAQWQKLLSIAISQLESVGADRDDWQWGGGTVLLLRYNHRHSQDVDIFLDHFHHLGMLSPRLNDDIERQVSSYFEEGGHHLRLEYDGLGEIDYLLVGRVIDPDPQPMDIPEIGTIQTMQDREILAQKIHFRAANFKGRDLFDFATLMETVPELAEDAALRDVAQRNVNALRHRLEQPGIEVDFQNVSRSPTMRPAPNFAKAKMTLLDMAGEKHTRRRRFDLPKEAMTASQGGSAKAWACAGTTEDARALAGTLNISNHVPASILPDLTLDGSHLHFSGKPENPSVLADAITRASKSFLYEAGQTSPVATLSNRSRFEIAADAPEWAIRAADAAAERLYNMADNDSLRNIMFHNVGLTSGLLRNRELPQTNADNGSTPYTSRKPKGPGTDFSP